MAGNLGTAAAAARADAPARAIAAATRGTTEADLAVARARSETAQRVGVPLTGAEAIQGATGNATKLGDLQRAAEGSLDGGAVLARVYADRPAQMRNAVDEALAALGPQSTAPSTIGPRAAPDCRGGHRRPAAEHQPLDPGQLAAGSRHVLDPADFEPLARDPAFRETLRQLPADPVLGLTYRDLPDNSVAVIDAVTKGMREAQGGGARFAKDIAGTEQQARNLDAVLEATGGPAVRQPIADVLDVLRATGTRKPQGSPTDFNQQIREAVGEMPLTAQALTALRTGGASLLTQAGDGAKRVWLGRNNRTLAEILAAPDRVGRIGTILQRGTATPFADAALRQALQSRSLNVNEF